MQRPRDQASRKIRPFRNFEGLSAEAATDLKSYFHFRNPESIEVTITIIKLLYDASVETQ